MPNTNSAPDADSIRDDISALRAQVADLVKHVGSATKAKAGQLYDDLPGRGAEVLRDKVVESPVSSVAIAFAIGAIVGRMMR